MPEFVEVEAYANTVRPLIGGTITGIDLRDERLLRRAEEGFDAEAAHVYGVMGGAEIVDVRRIGKLLLIDVSRRPHDVGLTFGLRGWLMLDGRGRTRRRHRRDRTAKPEHVRLAIDGRRASAS